MYNSIPYITIGLEILEGHKLADFFWSGLPVVAVAALSGSCWGLLVIDLVRLQGEVPSLMRGPFFGP